MKKVNTKCSQCTKTKTRSTRKVAAVSWTRRYHSQPPGRQVYIHVQPSPIQHNFRILFSRLRYAVHPRHIYITRKLPHTSVSHLRHSPTSSTNPSHGIHPDPRTLRVQSSKHSSAQFTKTTKPHWPAGTYSNQPVRAPDAKS